MDRRVEAPIFGGEVVRLLHPDYDMLLETTPRVELFGQEISDSIVVLEPAKGFGQSSHDAHDVSTVSYLHVSLHLCFVLIVSILTTRKQTPTTHSMWIIENVDPSDGSRLTYNSKVRIRNVATGGYL